VITEHRAARARRAAGKAPREQPGADGQQRHDHPGEHEGGADGERTQLPVDDVVGSDGHGPAPSPPAWGKRSGRSRDTITWRTMMKPARQASMRCQLPPITRYMPATARAVRSTKLAANSSVG